MSIVSSLGPTPVTTITRPTDRITAVTTGSILARQVYSVSLITRMVETFVIPGWLIGDNRGAPTGYIHNSDRSQACPYTIPGGWMFYRAQHGAWYPDTSLVLRCVTP